MGLCAGSASFFGYIRISQKLKALKKPQSTILTVSENPLATVRNLDGFLYRHTGAPGLVRARWPDSVWTVRGFRPEGRPCEQTMDSHAELVRSI